ncbi:hypothetical protein DES35_101851 [Schleiferia thermophila]|uniref:Uncharacterized protein n=1 Tax=Schleiferia thermophila TaxID=884107 RepID=A0A369ADQ6_9FLAO|nr:hypothetical protein DES35_101851 [Schleiferia thermophila]GCD78941.1 hypothetical protein JCM30197_01880 [Schleiferia thermophila]
MAIIPKIPVYPYFNVYLGVPPRASHLRRLYRSGSGCSGVRFAPVLRTALAGALRIPHASPQNPKKHYTILQHIAEKHYF